MTKLALRPNQLLTRRPLVLLGPPKSLMRKGSPYGNLKNILYEHGFQVEQWSLPFNNPKKLSIYLAHRQEQLNNCHVFIDNELFEIFQTEFDRLQLKNSTFTKIVTHSDQRPFFLNILPEIEDSLLSLVIKEKSIISNLYWKPFDDKNIDIVLKYCRFLAELDFNAD
jgi:hypothetical protein